ncbi:hypothetical protein VTI28DRAFT_7764 [Corynascus sepedonium]
MILSCAAPPAGRLSAWRVRPAPARSFLPAAHRPSSILISMASTWPPRKNSSRTKRRARTSPGTSTPTTSSTRT